MPRPRPYDDALRNDLLEAAGRALSEGGELAVSIRAVAAQAGTTTAGVYALFGSRDSLIEEVAARGLEEFRAHIEARPVHDDPREDIRELFLAYRRAALDMPHMYRAFGVVAARRGDLDLSGVNGLRSTLRAVRRLSPPDAPKDEVFETAVTVCAFVHGLVMFEIDRVIIGSEEDNVARFERALDTIAPLADR
ncbi:TetR/AcrR family transcriptional regulator [Georgenia sp. Z1344]|uniref:TetR/AcrR family transcriptional regulator n=1 Tax=Georgenia sp. Z1344 TaxID=3416706 RepID=UPI003CF7D076